MIASKVLQKLDQPKILINHPVQEHGGLVLECQTLNQEVLGLNSGVSGYSH